MKKKWITTLAIIDAVCLLIIGTMESNKTELYATAEEQQQTIKNLKTDIAKLNFEIEERKLEIQQELQAELEKPQERWVSIGNFKITYYGLDITTTTATGKTPEVGKTIGVDPEVIPYGSTVKIDGEVYEAQDTGAYKGNLIDILCESEAVSSQLGTHTSEVYILEVPHD